MKRSSLRLDRFLTLYFFYPLLGINPTNSNQIPILMYHSISDDLNKGIHPYYETSTQPKVFAQHMKYLYENGYNVITLGDAVKILEYYNIYSNKNLAFNKPSNQKTKYAVLTFDDGFHDFLMNAFPILNKYKFSATVFLPTAFINNNRRRFCDKYCLTWKEVKELRKKGIEFGSHTVNHLKLYEIDNKKIKDEFEVSKKKIENEIGESIHGFSYPFAFPAGDKIFVKFLKICLNENGYKYGVTTEIGTASVKEGCFFLRRIPVNSYDDPMFFKAKISEGYDWMRSPQFLYKFIKHNFY
jgi:peptidoglycan/xylan/chitin deacetylase (PgdA/CDA1 family)